jgi:hypothetical protein
MADNRTDLLAWQTTGQADNRTDLLACSALLTAADAVVADKWTDLLACSALLTAADAVEDVAGQTNGQTFWLTNPLPRPLVSAAPPASARPLRSRHATDKRTDLLLSTPPFPPACGSRQQDTADNRTDLLHCKRTHLGTDLLLRSCAASLLVSSGWGACSSLHATVRASLRQCRNDAVRKAGRWGDCPAHALKDTCTKVHKRTGLLTSTYHRGQRGTIGQGLQKVCPLVGTGTVNQTI